jgi:ankyrin repeat protein
MPLGQLAGLNRIDANEEAAQASGIWKPVQDLPALAQRAIDAGASVNERDSNGKTSLVHAIEGNNVDVAQVLLKAGADPNLDADGESILMVAMGYYANHHDPTMVKQLLEAGAAPNFRTSGDYSKPEDDGPPGGCCGNSGQTALTMAAESGDLALAQVLLSHGADPSIPRSDGALPADIARMEHHPLVAELIDKYAKSSGSKH